MWNKSKQGGGSSWSREKCLFQNVEDGSMWDGDIFDPHPKTKAILHWNKIIYQKTKPVM